MKKRLHLTIHGRVQGVFFRAHTVAEAKRLGLTGWVRNCPDGTVEALTEGTEDALNAFLTWCRHGPPLARVTTVDVTRGTATGEFPHFTLR